MYLREERVRSKCGARIRIVGQSRGLKSTPLLSKNLCGAREAGTIRITVCRTYCLHSDLETSNFRVSAHRGQGIPVDHVVERPSTEDDSDSARLVGSKTSRPTFYGSFSVPTNLNLYYQRAGYRRGAPIDGELMHCLLELSIHTASIRSAGLQAERSRRFLRYLGYPAFALAICSLAYGRRVGQWSNDSGRTVPNSC